jgi:hypothetical protein
MLWLMLKILIALLSTLGVSRETPAAPAVTEPPQIATEAPETVTPTPPAATPAPVVSPRHADTPDDFTRLAQCESSGDPKARSGPYYGLFQFDLPTWLGAVTRAKHPEWAERLPTEAPPDIQELAARQLQSERGWQPWPACSRKLGLA